MAGRRITLVGARRCSVSERWFEGIARSEEDPADRHHYQRAAADNWLGVSRAWSHAICRWQVSSERSFDA